MALMQQKVYLLQTTTTETRGVLRGPRGPKKHFNKKLCTILIIIQEYIRKFHSLG